MMANKNDRNSKVDSDRDTTKMDVNAGEALGTAGGGVAGAVVGSLSRSNGHHCGWYRWCGIGEQSRRGRRR